MNNGIIVTSKVLIDKSKRKYTAIFLQRVSRPSISFIMLYTCTGEVFNVLQYTATKMECYLLGDVLIDILYTKEIYIRK